MLGSGERQRRDRPLEVRRSEPQEVRSIPELTESTVAVEAQESADFAGCVVVVDVLCRPLPADGTPAVVRGYKLSLELPGKDPAACKTVAPKLC